MPRSFGSPPSGGFREARLPLTTLSEFAEPSLEVFFVTSDNPLLQWVPPKHHHSLYGTGGFRNKYSEAILTLSPTHCLVGHWREDMPKVFEASIDRVEFTNELIAASAERFLYSHVNSESLLTLAKQHADSQRVIHMGGGPEKKAEITVVRNKSKL